MRGRRIILFVLLAVAGEPGPHCLLSLHSRFAFSVDEQVVSLHAQPPVAAYCAAPLVASAACAAARRAKGTLYGEQET